MSRVQFPSKMSKPRMSEWCGRFPTNGAAAPAAANVISSEEVTVTYAATGKYTLTFQRAVGVLYTTDVTLRMGTAAGNYAQIDSITQTVTGIISVVIGTYNNAGTATAIAAAANNEINFDFIIQE